MSQDEQKLQVRELDHIFAGQTKITHQGRRKSHVTDK